METPEGMDTDHIDGDGLNNQRSNLRVCTHAENTRNVKMHKDNTSGFKGVCLHKATGKWRVEIMTNGKKVNIGLFVSKFDAHEAYVEACIKYHGNFSRV